MTDLLIRGELTPADPLDAYSWEDPSGMSVSVRGSTIEVSWEVDGTAINESFDQMAQLVESALLVESLDQVVPRTVRWIEYQESGPLGGFKIFAPTITQTWAARKPDRRMDESAGDALVVRTCPEVHFALTQFRLAMEAWRGDAKESMARMYIGLEELVYALTGDTGRVDWSRAGEIIGLRANEALRLYLSLQFGRHSHVTYAAAELEKLAVPAYNPGDCLEVTRRFLRLYLDRRVTQPCV